MFDFRRIILFCLGYRISSHKMIICSKIFLGGHAPLDPLATSMPSLYKPTWQLSRMRASLISYLLSSPQVRECSWFWRVSELPQHSHQRLC